MKENEKEQKIPDNVCVGMYVACNVKRMLDMVPINPDI